MPLKRKVLITLMLLGSGFFLYQGFSLLFHPPKTVNTAQESPTQTID